MAATPFSFPPPRCVPPDPQPLHAATSSFPPRCAPGLGERGDGGHVGDTCDDLAEPGPADPAVAEEGVEPPRQLEVGTADPRPCRPCRRIGDAQGRPPQSRLSLTCPTIPWRHSSQAPNCPTITTPASLACLRLPRRHRRGGHAFHSGIPGLLRSNPRIFPIWISFIPCTPGACIIVETVSLDFDQSCLQAFASIILCAKSMT